MTWVSWEPADEVATPAGARWLVGVRRLEFPADWAALLAGHRWAVTADRVDDPAAETVRWKCRREDEAHALAHAIRTRLAAGKDLP